MFYGCDCPLCPSCPCPVRTGLAFSGCRRLSNCMFVYVPLAISSSVPVFRFNASRYCLADVSVTACSKLGMLDNSLGDHSGSICRALCIVCICRFSIPHSRVAFVCSRSSRFRLRLSRPVVSFVTYPSLFSSGWDVPGLMFLFVRCVH